MTRVGIVAKTDAVEAPAALARLVGWLGERGVAVVLEKEAGDLAGGATVPVARREDLPGQVDLLVVLGGDGTLLSMARAWADSFWRPAAGRDMAAPGRPDLVAIGALSLLTLAISIGAEPLFELTLRGARQLLDRDGYVRAVLGDTP